MRGKRKRKVIWMKEMKPCKFAMRNGCRWECTCYRDTYCADQKFDRNPDDSINAVMCGYVERSNWTDGHEAS